MDRNNDRIKSSQLYSLLTGTILGIGVLSTPRSLAELAGPDSLIVVVAGSVVFLVITIMINKLISKHPNSTVIDIGSDLLGGPIGKIIGLFYVIYLVTFTALEVRAFGSLVKNFLLFNTPIEVIIITLLLTSVYTVRSGIETLGRFAAIALPLTILPALFTILLTLPEIDPTYFLPVFRTPIMNFAKAVTQMIFGFLGLEFILFLNPFVKDKKNIKKASIWSVITVASVTLAGSFITIGVFGIEETKTLIWPIVTIYKTINIPGTLLENVEVIIMVTWTISIFLTICTMYFGSALLFSKVTGSKEFNFFVFPLLPIIYVISLLPENVAELYDALGMFSNYAGSIFAVGIPLILLIVSYFKKPKKGMKRNA